MTIWNGENGENMNGMRRVAEAMSHTLLLARNAAPDLTIGWNSPKP